MKSLFISIVFLCSYSFNSQKNYNDFDNELSNLVSEFKNKIMNEDEVQDIHNDVESLIDEIENAIDDDELNSIELSDLKILKAEAEAIEEFIYICYSSSPYYKKDAFYLANKKIGASIYNVSSDKYCMDIIKIVLGDFVNYLILNKKDDFYRFRCEYNSENGYRLGSSEAGIGCHCYNSVWNNRDNSKMKNIVITSVTCTIFNSTIPMPCN